METRPPRNLGLDLVRATEAAALAASRFTGLGDLDEPNRAAAEAMVHALNTLDMDGHIVIGEEGRLGAHTALDTGQRVGTGDGPAMDVVVNPIDGRALIANFKTGSLAVAAVAPRGSMWRPAPAVYMDKIIVDREVAEALVPECMGAPAAWTVALVARVKKKAVRDVVVFVLDRPRHRDLIEEVRRAGARILLRSDGDIGGALLAADPKSQVDVLMGIGGASESVIAACAVKALGGSMLARLAPQSAAEREAVAAAGLDTRSILRCDELVASQQVFFAATGITDSLVLSGVRFLGQVAVTESLVLRAETGTRRLIQTEHRLTP